MNDKQNPVPIHHGHGFWPNFFEPLKQMGSQIAGWFQPTADAAETEAAYRINLELPGVEEKDIDIALNGNVLTVKGEKSSKQEEKTANYYFSERSYGAFQRAFRLPDDVETDKIDAAYENGVLALTLPRKAEKPSASRKIAIGAG